MKAKLTKQPNPLHHFVNDLRVEGPHNKVTGDVSNIYGDCTNIRGDVSNICGDVTGFGGDVSKVSVVGNINK